METNELLEILVQAGKLKQAKRHCFVEKDRQESVADHSYRVALMAFLLKNNFTDVDTSKVIEMCLIHDLGESFTGDIPTFEKNKKMARKNRNLWSIGFLLFRNRQDRNGLPCGKRWKPKKV